MEFIKNKSTRYLILIMTVIAIAGIVIAKAYYSGINNSVDPRIKPARELYARYNSYAQENSFDDVFSLLDSVEQIYTAVPHYNNSYELGVIYNNRAAAYITLALFRDSLPEVQYAQLMGLSKDSLLKLSEQACLKSISIYNEWQNRFAGKTADEISALINPEFLTGLENFPERQDKYLENRVKEIEDANWETDRRLSVAYTNLGLICRHRGEYEEAADYYSRALELWEDNLTAENNLNKLLGRPIKKRSILQKLFPKEREKSRK